MSKRTYNGDKNSRIQIKVSPQKKEKMKEIAEKTGLSISYLILQELELYLKEKTSA